MGVRVKRTRSRRRDARGRTDHDIVACHSRRACTRRRGPTLATTPVQPGLGDQVAQLARDLGLGPKCGAPAAEFRRCPEFRGRGSSQSGGEGESKSEGFSSAATAKPTAEYVRSRLLEMKGKVMKEPRG